MTRILEPSLEPTPSPTTKSSIPARAPISPAPSAPTDTDFSLTTVQCDPTRAQVHASGHLDASAAAVLAAVLDGHLRAGRRFLRLNVGAVPKVDSSALEVLSALHRRLLERRGTLIITGVTGAIERVLARADAGLFLLAPTAAERAS
jgi:anti-anti-sigma factor